ncbi:hypothetical protein B0H21DRAFT_701362 [Amylocystis lapponica]|nr:hypothetical protein B0H21DRAFT_701362 [Amylocystis lapponica]
MYLPHSISPSLLTIVTLFTFLSIHSFFATASLQNVTVDDTYGDPLTGEMFVYAPTAEWSIGQDCSSCTAHVDANDAYNGTWHDNSAFEATNNHPSNASISFNGTAVYVYCILASDGNSNRLWSSELAFLIDGKQVGTYSWTSTGPAAFQYDVPVYTNNTLTSGLHTFTLINGATSGVASLVLFDYLVYT